MEAGGDPSAEHPPPPRRDASRGQGALRAPRAAPPLLQPHGCPAGGGVGARFSAGNRYPVRFPSHVAVFSFFFPPPSPAPPTPTRRQLPHLLLTVPTPGEGRASLRALFRRAAVSPWELSREKFTITRSGVFPASPAPRGPRPPAFCARADADLLLGRCHGARRGLQRPELSPGAGVAGHLCPDTCWAGAGKVRERRHPVVGHSVSSWGAWSMSRWSRPRPA